MQNVLDAYRQMRDAHLEKAVDLMKKTYMTMLHPNRKPWDESTFSLQHYPSNSLGRRLYDFLRNGDIQLEPKYESHDVYHILSGYGLGMSNEARMFFFLFGNGKKSLSIIGSMMVALVFYPELWSCFFHDFKYGRKFKSFKDIDFQYRLHEDFETFRKSLRIETIDSCY